MLTIYSPADAVRQACLENNLAWLQSFGCQVQRQAGAIRVWHPDVADYRALIVPDARADESPGTELAIRTAIESGTAIYLDDTAAARWRPVLLGAGLHQAMASVVRALAVPPPRPVTGDIAMLPVPAADIARWSTLYARCFRHDGNEATRDLLRWRQAAASPQLGHFIFQHQGRDVGTCQLCWGARLAGLYSVGYEGAAARQALRPALALVCNEARRHGCGLIYFERLRPTAPRPGLARGKRTVRTYEVWLE